MWVPLPCRGSTNHGAGCGGRRVATFRPRDRTALGVRRPERPEQLHRVADERAIRDRTRRRRPRQVEQGAELAETGARTDHRYDLVLYTLTLPVELDSPRRNHVHEVARVPHPEQHLTG
jgi:hypothetical protein